MTRGALLSSLSSRFCTVESRGPTEVEGGGGKSRRPTNVGDLVGDLVGGLLELVF
jgi:hypothetical protein